MGDIRDTDAFVRAHVHRLRPRSPAEREELEGDGLVILCELNAGFIAQGTGTFSAYATAILPLRLISARHRRRGGIRRQLPDGTRRWEYPVVISLDALRERRGPPPI